MSCLSLDEKTPRKVGLMKVIGIAPDGETALKRIEECRPDIVTLDVELPGLSGLQALKQIRWPRLR
jgi:chemotaxis response regulator CheB